MASQRQNETSVNDTTGYVVIRKAWQMKRKPFLPVGPGDPPPVFLFHTLFFLHRPTRGSFGLPWEQHGCQLWNGGTEISGSKFIGGGASTRWAVLTLQFQRIKESASKPRTLVMLLHFNHLPTPAVQTRKYPWYTGQEPHREFSLPCCCTPVDRNQT